MTTQPLVVWTELPVRDVASAAAFYDAVLGTKTTVDTSGPMPMANIGDMIDGVGCSLFEGTPGAATLAHFAVPALEAATERLVALMLDEMGAHAAPPEIYARLALAP